MTSESLTMEQQSYVEELLAIRVTLCNQLHDDLGLITFVIDTTKIFKDQNTDLTYVFLKAVLKKLKKVSD